MSKAIALSHRIHATALSQPLAQRMAQQSVEIVRTVIVSGCAVALIAAGQALPF